MARQFEHTILHIGLHKTGTTTVQAGLFQNRTKLARDCGIFYPAWKANHSENLYSMFCDPRSRKSSSVEASKATLECETALAAASEKTMLLSGEDMSQLFIDGVGRLRDWVSDRSDNCRVIAVVRDPVEWFRSNVQQRVQNGRTLGELMENAQLQRVAAKLERYMSAFGRERLTVLHFADLSTSPDGLFVAFCEAVGIPKAWSLAQKVTHWNASLTAEAVELLSARNALTRAGADPPSIEDVARLSGTPGARFELPEGIRELVMQNSAQDADFLRSHFGIDLVRKALHP